MIFPCFHLAFDRAKSQNLYCRSLKIISIQSANQQITDCHSKSESFFFFLTFSFISRWFLNNLITENKKVKEKKKIIILNKQNKQRWDNRKCIIMIASNAPGFRLHIHFFHCPRQAIVVNATSLAPTHSICPTIRFTFQSQ